MLAELKTPMRAGVALLKGRAPGQLVVQFTDMCNAHCPQCGMAADRSFRRSKLDPRFVRRVLETAAGRGCVSVSLTGGEPLLYADQVFELLGHARDLGIRYTRTGTNGFLFQPRRKQDFHTRVARLAGQIREAGVYTFWISLDSANAGVHEQSRGLPGVVEGIRRALPILHHHGIYPAVNLGINRSMGNTPIDPLSQPEVFSLQARTALRDFYDTVLDMGFTTANVCYPMSFDNQETASAYRATSNTALVNFSTEERALLFQAIAEVTREYRSSIRIFTPVSSLAALSAQHSGASDGVEACRGGVDFFYLSAASRQLYPCGFRGSQPLGDPTDPRAWASDGTCDCGSCDWECFRDPSHMVAPLTRIFRHPARTASWMMRRGDLARSWWGDMRYYSACAYFSSTRPPAPDRLRHFRVAGDGSPGKGRTQ